MSRGELAQRRKEEGREKRLSGKLPEGHALPGGFWQEPLFGRSACTCGANPSGVVVQLCYDCQARATGALAPAGITGRESTKGSPVEVMPSGARVLIDAADVTVLKDGQGGVEAAKWVARNLLGVDLRDFAVRPGMYRKYRRVYQWGEIILACDGIVPGMGVHLHIQGEGCRQFEAWQAAPHWLEFVFRVLQVGQFTRLDLAADDLADEPGKGLLDVDRIINCKRPVWGYKVQDGEGGERTPSRMRTKLRSGRLNGNFRTNTGEDTGKGLYLGDRKDGDVLLRIYDKALQKGTGKHHVRCELELRDDRAQEAAKLLLQEGLGKVTCGILRNYVAFVKPVRDKKYSRWPVYGWWTRFLSAVEPLRLSTAPMSVTLEESLLWAENSVGPTLGMAYFALNGDMSRLWDIFVQMVMSGAARLKAKHFAKLTAWRVGKVDNMRWAVTWPGDAPARLTLSVPAPA